MTEIEEIHQRHWARHEEFGTQLTIHLPKEIPGPDAEEIEDQLVELAYICAEPYPNADIHAGSFKGEGCGWNGHPCE